MPNFFFQRYVHGERMAEDVLITKQSTLEAAIPEALRLCRNSPKSVLVYVPEDNALSDEITRLREENARLREALKPFSKNYWADDWHDGSDCEINVQLRDIRRAASLVDGYVWTPDE